MTNRPFDQQDIPQLQRPLSSDLNQLGSLLYYTMMFQQEFDLRYHGNDTTDPVAQNPPSGFLGNGFRASADGSSLNITLAKGLGFLYDETAIAAANTVPSGAPVVGVSTLSALLPLALKAPAVFTVPAPDGALTRYDLIEARNPAKYADSTVLDIFDPGSSQFVPGPAFKTYSRAELDTQLGYQLVPADPSTAGLSYKTGTPGAGVPPSTTAGYIPVAVIIVDAGATSIAANKVLDQRVMVAPGRAVRFDLRADGTAPSGTPDVIDGLRGCLPPGVTVVAQLAGSSPSYYRFYFFAGANAPSVRGAQVTPAYEVTLDPVLNVPIGYVKVDPISGTVDGALQTVLGSGATVFPNIEVAIGTRYTAIDVVLENFNKAATPPQFNQSNFPTAFQFFLSGALFLN